MAIAPGTYELGPQNAELLVNTRRSGAAARAGHDLEIVVTDWSGTLEVREPPEQPSVTLTADSSSLRVREGRGGMKALGEDDKDSIRQTIDDEVLKRTPIEFRSSEVETTADGNHMHVTGELELGGRKHPIDFQLTLAQQGQLRGTARVKQTDWGIKPYSGLFGTLKLVDEVEVTIDASLPT
jgi:polyisoprenoid-binding protein YceI